MINDKYVEQLIALISDMYNEINELKASKEQMAVDYARLSSDYADMADTYDRLANMVIPSDAKPCSELTDIGFDEGFEDDYPEDNIDKGPKQEEAVDGIFPSPASAAHSMVTGTTDQKCYALTAILDGLEQGVSVSKKVLTDQNLFEYRVDERGHNRYLPTEWFKEYGVSHGILAEFTGHANTAKGDVVFSWYKVTPYGKQIIEDTATGVIVWKKFLNGPSEWSGYIPIKKDNK